MVKIRKLLKGYYCFIEIPNHNQLTGAQPVSKFRLTQHRSTLQLLLSTVPTMLTPFDPRSHRSTYQVHSGLRTPASTPNKSPAPTYIPATVPTMFGPSSQLPSFGP